MPGLIVIVIGLVLNGKVQAHGVGEIYLAAHFRTGHLDPKKGYPIFFRTSTLVGEPSQPKKAERAPLGDLGQGAPVVKTRSLKAERRSADLAGSAAPVAGTAGAPGVGSLLRPENLLLCQMGKW